jgi:hypothetical protein
MGCTLAARTRTSNSPAPGTGFTMSCSEAAPPLMTTAFIRSPGVAAIATPPKQQKANTSLEE